VGTVLSFIGWGRADFHTRSSRLFVLYAPEREVEVGSRDAGFLGNLMFEVLLRFPRHD
jgi:hypothetical protein